MTIREVLQKYHKKVTEPTKRKQMLADRIDPDRFMDNLISELNNTKRKERSSIK